MFRLAQNNEVCEMCRLGLFYISTTAYGVIVKQLRSVKTIVVLGHFRNDKGTCRVRLHLIPVM